MNRLVAFILYPKKNNKFYNSFLENFIVVLSIRSQIL